MRSSGSTSAGACDTTQVAQNALPGVVTISAQGRTGSGSGSGAITKSDGTIVTNDHVISIAVAGGQVAVQLSDGTVKPATLIGRDPKTDLAVIKIEGTGLPTLDLGDDSALVIGQPVVALGAPLGLSNTVTAGIVSALGRDVPAPTDGGGTTVLVGTIQTDASINPGNSGGPLVNCTGQVVGINTAISTVPSASGEAGGGSVGIGFAVPAATVRSITNQLIASGRASHPWLGMAVAAVPARAGVYFDTPTGLYVQSLVASGPAAAAGILVGDIITQVGGAAATPVSLPHLLATAKVGDTVDLTYFRGGDTKTATLTLTEQP